MVHVLTLSDAFQVVVALNVDHIVVDITVALLVLDDLVVLAHWSHLDFLEHLVVIPGKYVPI